MSFLNKIRAYFFGDNKEKEKILEEQEKRGVGRWDCKWCEHPIVDGDKKTFNGYKWHKKCYREMIKIAKKEMGV